MEEKDTTFLGRGWSFPPRFDFENHTPVMVKEEKDVEESLRIIISTAQGERIMNPKFGSDLSGFIFDSIDSILINRITDSIQTAILNFEPRITLNKIWIDSSHSYDGLLQVHLEYTIRKINVRSNIVYPFYFKEGTNVHHM
jgi:phage baseplate assembly protein W